MTPFRISVAVLLALTVGTARADDTAGASCYEVDRFEGTISDHDVCVSDDLVVAFCYDYPSADGVCATWEDIDELIAQGATAARWTCAAGSDITHSFASRFGTEARMSLGFDADGTLVSGEYTYDGGASFCCGDGEARTLKAGIIDPVCLDPTSYHPALDPSTLPPVEDCGCRSGAPHLGLAFGFAALLVRRARSSRPQAPTRSG